MTTLDSLYRHLKQRLTEACVDNPPLAARLLIKARTGCADADFIARPDMAVDAPDVKALDAMADRHAAGEPVSRILGEREFWGLPFLVTPDVLDPRPDTETVIEAARKAFAGRAPDRILDLGTGSGCLAITLLYMYPGAHGVAVDLSPAALEVAGANAARNGVGDRLALRHGSWYDVLNRGERFDLIVSNPPYIPNPDIPNLDSAVRNHDPILALAGGIDGMDSYKIIISGFKNWIAPGGIGLFEIGIGQGEDVTRLVEDSGFSVSAIHPDLAGIPRVVEIRCGDK